MNNKKTAYRIILLLLLSLVVVGIVYAKSSDLFTPAGSSKTALSSSQRDQMAALLKISSPLSIAAASLSSGSGQKSSLPSLTFPIRAAFYYPWFPEAWTQNRHLPVYELSAKPGIL